MKGLQGDRFVRNAWYVAAWSAEVGRTPLARKVLGEPLVFFRKQDGSPVAFIDRCPHKLAPLSRGEVIGDLLQCGYHGMQMTAAAAVCACPASRRSRRRRGFGPFRWSEIYRRGLDLRWARRHAAAPHPSSRLPEHGDPKWGLVDGQYHADFCRPIT